MRKSRTKLNHFNSIQEFQKFITETYQFVKNKFIENNHSQSHSLEHTIRVTNTCLTLAQRLGAKIDILLTAALFHDVGRAEEEKTGQNHAEISAEIAEDYLRNQGKQDMVNEVCDAIISHRFSVKTEPKFKEGKILKDADALDALGTIGLYRVVSYSAERNVDMQGTNKHFHDKLLVLSSLMHFKFSRKLAEKKSKILISFSNGLERNIDKSKFEKLLQRLEK
ncbi:MAG: HD domain-containing protein [Candidatus Heimdallarchaeota archaeon]|nr:HD domain-containing protein [Candidatus Heimdallarchaeota archaeon]